jgi:hypothetical protein
MSHGASGLVWHHSKAKGIDLLVLMAIANYISDEGAFPKVETLARDARTSPRQAHRSLKTLKELGEIDWVQKAGKGSGVYKSNLYFIKLACPDDCSGDWNHTPIKSVTSRPDTVSHLDLTATADKPVNEPVIKPVTSNQNKKPHLLPDDWQPSERLLAMFATKWPLINEKIQTEKFKLHRWAKGDKMVDWDLAYQKWMNQAQEWAAEKQPAQAERKILGDF